MNIFLTLSEFKDIVFGDEPGMEPEFTNYTSLPELFREYGLKGCSPVSEYAVYHSWQDGEPELVRIFEVTLVNDSTYKLEKYEIVIVHDALDGVWTHITHFDKI